MNGYLEFVEQLDEHLQRYAKAPAEPWVANGLRMVNGLAAEELRRLVDLDTRREYGAFFTSSELALELISGAKLEFPEDCICYDPAVGAGNLLIAAIKALAGKTGRLTLLGTDLHAEFIHAATLRVQISRLIAKVEHLHCELAVSDGLRDNDYYRRATHIVTNPPFNLIDGDKSIGWGSGKLSAAAVFIDRIITFVRPGTPIIAILPDVLRSGSRYEKWRRMITEHCTVTEVRMLGQFDKYADVDVFSAVFTKKTLPDQTVPENIWTSATSEGRVVADLFEVSVGNVVDNRDPHDGPLRPFVVSRGMAGWQQVNDVARRRQFAGRALSGPFVVVKRTSRMGDKHRAVATIIHMPEPVFVDNHLIVLKPKSGKLKDCRDLVTKFQLAVIDDWINEQIRCRHLTVKIVSRIPI